MKLLLASIAVAAGAYAALEARMPALAQDAPARPAIDLDAPPADKLRTATFALG